MCKTMKTNPVNNERRSTSPFDFPFSKTIQKEVKDPVILSYITLSYYVQRKY